MHGTHRNPDIESETDCGCFGVHNISQNALKEHPAHQKDLQTGCLYLLLNQPKSVDKDSEGQTVILHMLGEIKDYFKALVLHFYLPL